MQYLSAPINTSISLSLNTCTHVENDSEDSVILLALNDLSTDLLKILLKTLHEDRIPRSTAIKLFNDLVSVYNKHIGVEAPMLTSLLGPKYLTLEFLILKKLSLLNIK